MTIANSNQKITMLFVTLACLLLVVSAETQEDYSQHPDCKPPECPADQIINKPHPYDCTKYISCDNGDTNVKSCPSGYKFNLQIRECEVAIGGAGQGCIPCWEKRPDYGQK